MPSAMNIKEVQLYFPFHHLQGSHKYSLRADHPHSAVLGKVKIIYMGKNRGVEQNYNIFYIKLTYRYKI